MDEAIKKWNFWWWTPQELKKTIGVQRSILPDIVRLLKVRHIKDIIGVRRAGKTFTMYQVIHHLIQKGISPKQVLYLNFEDPEFLDVATTIKRSLEMNPEIKYVFLDEVQQAGRWENIVRTYYDQRKFDQIFVSGSSASLISRDVGKTLTGRHVTVEVFPFSFKEFLGFFEVDWKDPANAEKVLHYTEKYLLEGGFPETVGKEEFERKTLLVNLYNDILARDIASRFDVDFDIVKKLAYYLMTNVGSPFSYSSISRSLGFHYETVKKYLPLLEEVFLFYYIPFFSYKLKIQVKKGMKPYAVDPGLRNAVSFKFSDDLGKLAENVVLAELKRRKAEVFFWKQKNEVDFVVKEGNTLHGINVCYFDSVPRRELKGLTEFSSAYKNTKLTVITRNYEKKEKRIKFVPLWKWLLT